MGAFSKDDTEEEEEMFDVDAVDVDVDVDVDELELVVVFPIGKRARNAGVSSCDKTYRNLGF